MISVVSSRPKLVRIDLGYVRVSSGSTVRNHARPFPSNGPGIDEKMRSHPDEGGFVRWIAVQS
jgi:hypothetical protein